MIDCSTYQIAELAKVGEEEREEAVDKQAQGDLLGSMTCGSATIHHYTSFP